MRNEVFEIAELYDNKQDLLVWEKWKKLIRCYNVDLCLEAIKHWNCFDTEEKETMYLEVVSDLESIREYYYSLIYSTMQAEKENNGE